MLRLGATIVAASLGLLLLAGCGGDPTPTPTAAPLDGSQLFVTKGCATCHGEQGQGGSSGPSIVHHSVEQVTDKVRNSTGNMPAFDESRISDEELEAIAAFVAELEGDSHGHDEPDHGDDHSH